MISQSQKLHLDTLDGLRGIGYRGGLLAENYRFVDWFSGRTETREAVAVAFGQTPISYETACIGVVKSNGLREQELVDGYRALGAPVILEIADTEVREWAVSLESRGHRLVETYPQEQIGQLFLNRAPDWNPKEFLRAKNIGTFRWLQQLDLFSGLLPELEGQIQEKMEPMLLDALSATKAAYKASVGRNPNPKELFRLIFWMLTAKVFHDREVPAFRNFDKSDDPDSILSAVGKHYRMDAPKPLNKVARRVSFSRVWKSMDFRNLSVEVLAQIWSTALVDEEVRKRLGIHRTSRPIVRYLIERTFPAVQSGDDKRIILEPCCGSGVFLIGAMNALRHKLFGMTPGERHQYFVKHLVGIEQDAFGVELSRLALTLADFPNPDGWRILPDDVFADGQFSHLLTQAGVVFCNPPFEQFGSDERREYSPRSVKKPAEVLLRVLDSLHPNGILGFVLPRNFVDGNGYAEVRKQLAERFATIELTLLPDRAFEADSEICLLIATEPIPHSQTRIINRLVHDNELAWKQFELAHNVSHETSAGLSPEQGSTSFLIPRLADVWDYLKSYRGLAEVARIHRGIEWNKPLIDKGRETGFRDRFIRPTPAPGYMLGVGTNTDIRAFKKPSLKFLSMKEEDQRGNAHTRAWSEPKVIFNKSARSRYSWRIAAFPDTDGITCYQTYTAAWPQKSPFDIWVLSAILNSPIANAFIATREGKTDIRIDTLRKIPVPFLTVAQAAKIRGLVSRYILALDDDMLNSNYDAITCRALMEIDAAVLDAYQLPPILEFELLSFFRGQKRPSAHSFGDYFPDDLGVRFSLSDFLSPEFSEATAGRILERLGSRKSN